VINPMMMIDLSLSRRNFGFWALPLLLLASSACSSQTVKLVQPRSGATAECSASGFGIGAAWVEETLRGCVEPYESRGYVPVAKLMPEQKADLERRGLLPE
jgi:hypothetical protein